MKKLFLHFMVVAFIAAAFGKAANAGFGPVTFVADGPLQHQAWANLDAGVGAPLAMGRPNWGWIGRQVDADGDRDTTDIQMLGRHHVAPHAGEPAPNAWFPGDPGLDLIDVIPPSVPGGGFPVIAPPTFISHGDHTDWLQVRVDVLAGGIRRMSLQLDHVPLSALDGPLGMNDDCNGNGILDSLDIEEEFSLDCNQNWIPDECESDCNGNEIPDDCDGSPASDDCNNNGIMDACDIAIGESEDQNENGIPDECEAEGACCDEGITGDCQDGLTAVECEGLEYARWEQGILCVDLDPPCEGAPQCVYIVGDCNHNGVPLELGDVITMISMYRGTIDPPYVCNCPPHGSEFAPTADPNGNCIAFELGDAVTEIGAYRGTGEASGCEDCPGSGILRRGDRTGGY